VVLLLIDVINDLAFEGSAALLEACADRLPDPPDLVTVATCISIHSALRRPRQGVAP
jgi:hypothetical protein